MEKRQVVESFLCALTERRFDALDAFLAPDVEFWALLPDGLETASDARMVTERLCDWFGGDEPVAFGELEITGVSDRWAFSYRALTGEDGNRQVVQQSGFAAVGEHGIDLVHLVCSGFLPVEASGAGRHRFDAGHLGCADGLAQEFRRELRATPVGGVLEILTSDPAAREDLPPLARMMGNTVLNIQTLDDGRVAITVERNR